MSATFVSGAANQLEEFVRRRRAAGSLCAANIANLRRFDAHCAASWPDEPRVTQEMVDSWCARRPTESANTCRSRCHVIVVLVRYLRGRGEAGLSEPDLPRAEESGYVPHAFTEAELSALFEACDAHGCRSGAEWVRRRNELVTPVLFRLLYSSGIRVGEARLLRRANVDLGTGVLRVVEGKGRNERLVALHPSMLELVRRYDALMEAEEPGRTFFFPNGRDGHLGDWWVVRHFRRLWATVSDERATAYQLRHQHAVENIDGMLRDGIEGLEDMEYLSKSLGHASIDVTVGRYYHITPSLAEALQERCGDSFDRIAPEVSR